MTDTIRHGRGFTLDRTFAAPPDMVFDCWTNPALLDWFYNPGHAVSGAPEVDLRVGGQWRQEMVIDDKTRYFTGGIYREISKPSRLVFNWGAVDGWPKLDPADPDGSPLIQLDFSPIAGGTLMQSRLDLPARFDDAEVERWFDIGIRQGWTGTVARLVEKLGAV